MGIATIDELRIPGRNDVSKSRLLECWQHILDNINYYPIFRIASDLLRPIPDGTANAVLNRLAQAASDLAGLGRSEDEQQAMAKRLAEIRQRLANPVGHGNAGLASNFIDLAHVKTKPGGVLALVLPASCVSGGSWEDVRRLLEREYENLAVLTIAAHGDTDLAFSADTGMAEALVVATKCRAGQFEIIPIQGVPQYPVLWGHDAERERSLVVLPDSEGEVRPGCDARAIDVWNATASRLHFNLDFRINSQSLTACLTPTKAIGGRAWPNFIPEQAEVDTFSPVQGLEGRVYLGKIVKDKVLSCFNNAETEINPSFQIGVSFESFENIEPKKEDWLAEIIFSSLFEMPASTVLSKCLKAVQGALNIFKYLR